MRISDWSSDVCSSDLLSPVGSLSGGERNRLLLAQVLARPSNFLVLDEPTNDLDMDTLDLLQELLADYEGTLLLVSHDRDFLDRVVTSTIALEGSGRAEEIGRAHVCTPVTNAQRVCRLLLDKKSKPLTV